VGASPSAFSPSPMTPRFLHRHGSPRLHDSSTALTASDGYPGVSLGRSTMAPKGETVGIRSTRGVLYWLARLLGDVEAVKKGRVGRRVGRRLTGRLTGRWLGRLFK
jgi:hypothetical protein